MNLKQFLRIILPDYFVKTYFRFKLGPAPLEYKSLFEEMNKIPKGEYQGQRCFILGSGPSLNLIDLNFLKNENVIALNKGFLLQERGLDNVLFYGISDRGAYLEYGHLIPQNFAKYFCVIGSIPWNIEKFPNTSFFSMYSEHNKQKKMANGYFQSDINHPLAHAFTVALEMLQIVVYAGFKDIYFVGIDNDFSGPNMHFYIDSQKEKQNMKIWNFNPCPDNEKSFECAYKILKKQGVNLYNAGVGGKLNALPRVDFKSLF